MQLLEELFKTRWYRPEAFQYLTDNAAAINQTAATLGVSAAAIAGAMAEEHHAYITREPIHLSLDLYALSRLPDNPTINAAYQKAKDDGVAESGRWQDKKNYPVLLDVGPANFKFSTALRLLHEYDQNPIFASDPLDLKWYVNDPRKLLEDLLIYNNPVTAKNRGPGRFFAVKVKSSLRRRDVVRSFSCLLRRGASPGGCFPAPS